MFNQIHSWHIYESGVAALLIRWLQVKQQCLICTKINRPGDSVAREPRVLPCERVRTTHSLQPDRGWTMLRRGWLQSSISVSASQNVQQLWGELMGCQWPPWRMSPWEGRRKGRPSSQPSALLGFGPCGSCFQRQWLRSASLVRCSDKALITTDE